MIHSLSSLVLGLGENLTSTNTPRIELSKPDENELMSPPNVDRDWNDPMDTLDSHGGMLDCTSGTRPANPYLGQLIRETDTSKLLVWNGSSWNVYSTKDAGWHFSGLTSLTPSSGIVYGLVNWSSKETYNVGLGNGIIVNTPGIYFACLNIRWSSRQQNLMGFPKGAYLDHVASGSSTVIGNSVTNTPSNSDKTTNDAFYQQVGGIFICDVVGQKIEPKVYQASGGAYNLLATDSRFMGVLLAPMESY